MKEGLLYRLPSDSVRKYQAFGMGRRKCLTYIRSVGIRHLGGLLSRVGGPGKTQARLGVAMLETRWE